MKLGRFAYCKRVRFVIALLKYLKPGRMTFYEICIYIFIFLGKTCLIKDYCKAVLNLWTGKPVRLFPSNKWTAGVADVNPLGTCLTSHSQQWFGSTVSVCLLLLFFFQAWACFSKALELFRAQRAIFSLSVFKNFLYEMKPLFILKTCE